MKRVWIVSVFGALLASLAAPAPAEPLTLADQGKSLYCIYHDASAPSTVKQAAAELQRVVQKATGVKLPIKQAPASPMICLGVNEPARAAGFDKDLPEFGFRIASKGKDIFILGPDTADGQEKWVGDGRRGTHLGTMDFLERTVNVRWLMPGDVGEDIPTTAKVVLNDLNVRETPTINYRWLSGIKDERGGASALVDPSVLAAVGVWKDHNKVDVQPRGGGVNWSHSFNSYPTEEMRKAHPEILAVDKNGNPVRMDKSHMMYCLSKPILYDLYAQCILDAFAKHPKLYSMSMSPDEGTDFCQCPDCAKLTTAPSEKWKDLGVRSPQHTAAVLRFYNEVAGRVRAKYPDRKVGAFIYQAYLEPLPEPVKMEPNIVFGVAMNTNYGFKLYQPRRQAVFQTFFDEWGKYGAEMGYYSYDTWMRNWFGMPLPPGRALLKWNFPMYKRNHVKYLSYIGQDAWGYGAVHNYLVAKLMWNADADVDALYNEFLVRAYGAKAGPLMGQIYDLVDANLQKYIQSKPGPDHEIDYAAAKAVYAPIHPEIERLYLEALATTQESSPQRARLEMFGDNLVMANFHMRKSSLLAEDQAKKSPLYRSDDDLKAFIAQKDKTLAIINVSQYLKTYKNYKGQMPVLQPNWRPR